MSQAAIAIAAVVFVGLNVFSFALYGIDKRKAIKKEWRIPEASLLLAAVFGIFGAIAGMLFFHHKTKKPKFTVGVPAILIAEIILAVLVWHFRGL